MDNFDVYLTKNSIYFVDRVNWKYMRSARSDFSPPPYLLSSQNTVNLIYDEWKNIETDIPIEERVKILDNENGEKTLCIRYKGSMVGIITTPLQSILD